jgi:cytidyltransferase-like protein
MSGKIVGVKSGCFTILHWGHIYALEYAKERVDYLIVLTNTDDRIEEKKGCVPIPLDQRLKILASLRCVDEVSWFPQATEDLWVKKFRETRLHQEFGEDSRIIMFHDPNVYDNPPCRLFADELVFIPRIAASVTDIFKSVRQSR